MRFNVTCFLFEKKLLILWFYMFFCTFLNGTKLCVSNYTSVLDEDNTCVLSEAMLILERTKGNY